MQLISQEGSEFKTLSTWPVDNDAVQIIPRAHIRGFTDIALEGVSTYLGEVRNFKNHSRLKDGLPNDLSISWTKMPAGRELPAHYHPCASMIVVTKGTGRSTGDTEIDIKEGDVIWIPEWNLHGFRGTGEQGFEALSIQFQETAIFESAETPETTYEDRNKVPLQDRQLKVIGRADLPEINSVETHDAGQVNLGVVKGFAGSEFLAARCPDFFSAAWVRLQGGERLSPHKHGVESMIIVTHGTGRFLGDGDSAKLETGDVVFVPAGASHGFGGVGEGFWGLSIQFQPESLYDTGDDRNVQFLTPRQQLVSSNLEYAKEFKGNPIFQFQSRDFLACPEKKQALLDCLQVMSDHFQRLMFARMAYCSRSEYRAVFLEHFLEELGHNTDLEAERGNSGARWNPILEASASWFLQKNQLLDDPSRVVMIQMVLEKGASLFYSHFAEVLSDGMQSEYILKHCDADEGHDSLGVDLLQGESDASHQRYQELLKESWSMLNLFLSEAARVVSRAKTMQ
ncbi:MAG: cupin domain-containing protein [Bdellovibrionales bacterium]|nr:cupin domain-containing protein [Bdellovibrionales bacterium]